MTFVVLFHIWRPLQMNWQLVSSSSLEYATSMLYESRMKAAVFVLSNVMVVPRRRPLHRYNDLNSTIIKITCSTLMHEFVENPVHCRLTNYSLM